MSEKLGARINPNPPLIDQAVLERVLKLSTPLISDVMGRTGAMDHNIKPVTEGMKMAGTAITVDLKPADNLFLHKALYASQKGYVLVADAKGHLGNSPWGEIMSTAAIEIGLNGIVLDGSVRDIAALRKLGFPVFAKGINPQGGDKDAPGVVNGLISCGGIPVCPGDLVFGDDDGVIVVPFQQIEQVISLAEEKARQEQKRIDSIKAGLFEPAWLQTSLERLGL